MTRHFASRAVRSRTLIVKVLAAACAGVGSASARVEAADGTWVNPAGGNWTTGTNWSTDPAFPDAPGDVAVLGNAIDGDRTVLIDRGITLGRLVFDGSHAYTVAPSSSAGRLIFDAPNGAQVGFSDGNAAHRILTPMTLASGLDVGNPEHSLLTFGGSLSGAGRLRKVGQGTLSLSGNNGTWSGALDVLAGTVRLDYVPDVTGRYTGLGTGFVTVHGGAMLALQNTTNRFNPHRVDNGFHISGNGVNGQGAISLDTGRVAILSGNVMIADGAAVGASNGSTVHIGDIPSGAGALAGSGGLDKVGLGGTVQLNVRSTHTGGTRVREGTLLVSQLGSLVGTGGTSVDAPGRFIVANPAGNDPLLHGVNPNSVSLRGGIFGITSNADPATFLAPDSTGGTLALHGTSNSTFGGTNTLDFNALPGGATMRLSATADASLAPSVVITPHASHNTYRLGGAGAVNGGRLVIASNLADANGVAAHVEHDVTGITFLKGANTYSGETVVRGGILAADNDAALGRGTGVEADGTTVYAGGTLSVVSGATIANELITLRGGTLGGAGTVDGSVVLASDSTIGGSRIRGVVSGSGNLTLSGPISGSLEGANTYTGNTRVTAGSFDVRHAQALGAATAGTEVLGGELHLYVNTQEPIVGKGGTISLRTASYDGPIALSGGTLAALGSSANATMVRPLELRSGRSTVMTWNGGALSLAGGTTGEGDLVLDGVQLSIDGPLSHNGRTIARAGSISVNTPVNIAGGLAMEGPAGLEFKEDSTAASLQLNAGRLLIKPGKTLAVGGDELLLRAGSIQGNLSGPSIIRKIGSGAVSLDLIGDSYDPDIVVEQGTLRASPWGLGSSNKATTVASADAVLALTGGTHSETIFLDNATGIMFGGALQGVGNARLNGPLDLGNNGSSVAGAIMLGGPIKGGALHIVDGMFAVAGDANTYTGPTVVHGTLSLREKGRIAASSEIVVAGPDGVLEFDDLEVGGHGDHLADSIPITLHGGRLVRREDGTGQTVHETVGQVRVGHGAVDVESHGPRLTLSSLVRTGTGTVRIVPVNNNDLTMPNVFVGAPPTETNGIIGGWAIVGRSGHADFATHDATVGIRKLAAAGRPQQVQGAGAADNVRFTGDAMMSALTADTRIHSLVVDPDNQHSGVSVGLNLGGRTLNIASGGLLKGGPGTLDISNGKLTAGGDTPGGEVFVTNVDGGTIRVAADVTDNPGGRVGLTQSGGMVVLSGVNTYTGPTVLNAGHLRLDAASALPANTDLVINSGSVMHDFPRGTFLDIGTLTLRGRGAVESVNADRYDVESGSLHRLAGNGPLFKVSHGLLSLTDNAAYSGDITVDAGTLAVRSADALGSGLTTIKDRAVITFDHSSFAYAGRIRLEGAELSALGSSLAATAAAGAGTGLGGGTLAGGGANVALAGPLDVYGRSRLRVADAPPGANAVPNHVRLTGATSIGPDARLLIEGPGVATLDGTLSAGPGSTLAARESTVNVNNSVTGGMLAVSVTHGGAVRFAAAPILTRLVLKDAKASLAPAQARATIVSELALDAASTFDLADNDLIVRADATSRDAVLATVTGLLRTARSSSGGRWRGPGLTSSAAELNPLVGLAAITNAGLAQFGGQQVAADDVLVKYTWNGDANVDGVVNADDYFRIDSGFLAQAQSPTYADGDFNYDGTINADDYFLIDSAFLGQGGTLAATALNVVAVPEPATGLVLALGLGVASRRRRSRRAEPGA